MEATITTGPNGHTRELREVALHDLTLDAVINRTVDERWVAKLAEEFNPLAIGLFTVWETEDGVLKIVDGQHRFRAANVVGYDDAVPCFVHRGLTEADAAELFLSINNQRNVSAIDKFRKAVQAGHREEVAVAGVLDEYGLVVGTATGDVGSPTVLLQIRREGGDDLLRKFIDTLTLSFEDMTRAQALHGELLSAVLYALKKYGKAPAKRGAPRGEARPYVLDLDRLREKLVDVGMVELFAKRDVKHRDAPQYTKRWHLSGQIVEVYNQGESRGRRLEAWSYRAA